MFLMSILPTINKLDNIQRLNLRMDFLCSVRKKLQMSRNGSLSTPSPHACSLDSTHYWDSNTLTHASQMPFMSSMDLHIFIAATVSGSILKTYSAVCLL
jgi:hypothetical protein